MVEYKILLTEEERFNLLAEEYFEAVEYEDWEKVASLIKLNLDIMAEGLELVYRRLPDQYKYSIPTSCYTHNGDRMPIVRKYVRQARKYAPIEERIPAEMIGLPEIEIYRAGAEPLDKAAYRISWTTSLDVAKWFHDRAVARLQPQRQSTRVSSSRRRLSGIRMAGKRKRSCSTTASGTLLSLSGDLPL